MKIINTFFLHILKFYLFQSSSCLTWNPKARLSFLPSIVSLHLPAISFIKFELPSLNHPLTAQLHIVKHFIRHCFLMTCFQFVRAICLSMEVFTHEHITHMMSHLYTAHVDDEIAGDIVYTLIQTGQSSPCLCIPVVIFNLP